MAIRAVFLTQSPFPLILGRSVDPAHMQSVQQESHQSVGVEEPRQHLRHRATLCQLPRVRPARGDALCLTHTLT